MIIIVMGVAGSGKSSVGGMIAERLGWPFLEGDAFHTTANKAKMEGGTPLTDEDRWPWLDAMAAHLGKIDAAGANAVLACSALRKTYRDRLRAGADNMQFVHLAGTKALLATRIGGRTGHYMPPALLDSQLATLEPPGPDEGAITLDIGKPVDTLADAVLAALELNSRQ